MFTCHLARTTLTLSMLAMSACGLLAQEKPQQQKSETKDKAEKKSLYLRVTRDTDGDPLAMQTAIIRFKPAAADSHIKHVDLIGAVHVGDRSYYKDLNDEFKKYDAVLYELVAPEGNNVPKKGRRGAGMSAIGGLQNGMKSMLELDHQLERIDYTKENFIHADMSPEEFAKSMEDRDESFTKMFFRMMGQGMAQQQKTEGSNDVAMLFALFSDDRALRLKRIVAQQFEDLEGQMMALDGPDGSTIITERNKKCFEVLAREIKAGDKKKIAIFYGAGHFKDMEERLVKEFKMQRKETRWLTAWKLTK